MKWNEMKWNTKKGNQMNKYEISATQKWTTLKNLIQCAIHCIYSLLLYINSDFSLFIYSFGCSSSFLLLSIHFHIQFTSHTVNRNGQIGKYGNIHNTRTQISTMDATIVFITGNIKSKRPIARNWRWLQTHGHFWRECFCMCMRVCVTKPH